VEPDATPIAQPSAVDGSSQTKVAKKSQKRRVRAKNRRHTTPAGETDDSSDSSSDSSSDDDGHHSVTKVKHALPYAATKRPVIILPRPRMTRLQHPAVTAHPDIPASNPSAAADPIIASPADEPIIASPADEPIISSPAGVHDKPGRVFFLLDCNDSLLLVNSFRS
jgi:hypothetical protein